MQTKGSEQHCNFQSIISPQSVKECVQSWLKEDTPSFDFGGIVVGDQPEKARIVCKQNGVLAGVPFVNAVFNELGCSISWMYEEGEKLFAPLTVAVVKGPARNLLLGERVALNILSRASGVASQAMEAKKIASKHSWHGQIAGTRKTTPGFRLVEKYSLLIGGATQHRYDLSSMVMLKDNHIWTAGDITRAVDKARRACGFSQKIEVECRSYEEAYDAIVAGADIVMLDNFSPEAAKLTALELKKHFSHVVVEVSGGINHCNVAEYFSSHIDVLSMSCLTQGYPCIDFSMKIEREGHDPENPTVKFCICNSSQEDLPISDDG